MARPDYSMPDVLKPLEPITRAYWILHPQKALYLWLFQKSFGFAWSLAKRYIGKRRTSDPITIPEPPTGNQRTQSSVLPCSETFRKLSSPVHGAQEGTLFPCGIEHEASVEG